MQVQNEITRYKIEHRTLYKYGEPVAVCQNQVRMMPAAQAGLTCYQTQIEIQPPPDSSEEHQDYFGNRVFTFAIESNHESLEIIARSDVGVKAPPVYLLDGANINGQSGSVNQAGNKALPISDSGEAWESVAAQVASPTIFQPLVDQQRFDSPRIRRSDAFAQYARASFLPGRGILEAALDLTRRIYTDFKYDTSATDVDTTPEEAFAVKAGVCQDFAQVAIASIRSIGLPARYVSGYLRTIPPAGKPALVGADESHAWFSVYSGPQYGWVGFDPTNGTLVGTDHIPISIGRDYGDISPMSGVVLGGGVTTLKVSVDVHPVTLAQQQSAQQQSMQQ
jgi:transglutaminase-like putative cysteine protease